MRITLNTEKRYMYVVLCALIILTGIVVVYAYNAPGVGGNPAIMGHDASEVGPGIFQTGIYTFPGLVGFGTYGGSKGVIVLLSGQEQAQGAVILTNNGSGSFIVSNDAEGLNKFLTVSQNSLEIGKSGTSGDKELKLSMGTGGNDIYLGNHAGGFRISPRPGLSPSYLTATSDAVYIPNQLCIGDSTNPANCRTSWPTTTPSSGPLCVYCAAAGDHTTVGCGGNWPEWGGKVHMSSGVEMWTYGLATGCTSASGINNVTKTIKGQNYIFAEFGPGSHLQFCCQSGI